MKTKLICLLLLISGINNSFAQTKMEKIREFLKITNYEAVMDIMSNSIIENYDSQLPNNEEVKQVMREWIAQSHEAILDSMVLIYDNNFSEKEIDDIIAFYKTPSGKKMLDRTPILTEAGANAGHNWAVEHTDDLKERLAKVLGEEANEPAYKKYYNPDEEFKKLSPYSFKKSKKAKGVFKSEKFAYELYFMEEDWVVGDCSILGATDAEVCFYTKDQQIVSMIIAEDVKADLHELKAVALNNANKATEDFSINNEGLVEVNKKVMYHIQMEAFIDGFNISYHNYYVSTDWGVIQILTFCNKADYEKNLTRIKDFNNGVILKK